MDLTTIIKPVVLTTVELGTTFAVGAALNKAVIDIVPELGSWSEEWTRKEKTIQAAKLIGVSVGIALVAGVVATAARSATEQIIWSDEHRIIESEPVS